MLKELARDPLIRNRPRNKVVQLVSVTAGVVHKYPNLIIGSIIVGVLVVVAICAPWIASYSPTRQFTSGLTEMGLPVAPSHHFLLGTDPDGRDVFSRVVFGARISLEVGTLSALLSLVIGVALGLISGFFGKWVDMVVMRVTDAVLAFPFILFVIALVAVLRPSTSNLFLAIGLLGWANMARVVRAQVLVVRELEYVEAAKALGASRFSVIFVEILPNILAPAIVLTALSVGTNMMAAAALSFLDLGVQPPTPSWGNMLQSGMTVYQSAPWMIYGPGLALLLAIVGFNLLGDGLRDRLNPKLNV